MNAKIEIALSKESLLRVVPLSLQLSDRLIKSFEQWSSEMISNYISALRHKANNNTIKKTSCIWVTQRVIENYKIPQLKGGVDPVVNLEPLFDSLSDIRITKVAKKIIKKNIKMFLASPIDSHIQKHHISRRKAISKLIVPIFANFIVTPEATHDITDDLTHVLDLVNIGMFDARGQDIVSCDQIVEMAKLPMEELKTVPEAPKFTTLVCQAVQKNTRLPHGLIEDFSRIFGRFVLYYCAKILNVMNVGDRFIYRDIITIAIEENHELAETLELTD
jgi:hypothetical protein